jgi:hypothetical protein
MWLAAGATVLFEATVDGGRAALTRGRARIA